MRYYTDRKFAAKIEERALCSLEHGEEYQGICLECGETRYEVEPDAEGYRCPFCNENAVMGMEQVVLGAY